jgi:hypothetical protein
MEEPQNLAEAQKSSAQIALVSEVLDQSPTKNEEKQK